MTMKVLILILGLAWGLSAQTPGMFPWWDSPLARDLKLSDDQRTQIRATVREYRDSLIRLRADVERAEAAFRDVLDEESLDRAAGERAIEQLVASRAELTRLFSEMSLKMRSVLTAEQWQQLRERAPRRPGRPGPGERPRYRPRPGPPQTNDPGPEPGGAQF
jgi:Spy/CpxP family protein refolding chaperone